METLAKLLSAYIIIPIPGYKKLIGHLMPPAEEFFGFTIFFITFYSMRIITSVTGNKFSNIPPGDKILNKLFQPLKILQNLT